MIARALPRPLMPASANKLEVAYAEHLEALRIAGHVSSWSYEAVRLKLGEGAWFTPDFMVVARGDEVEFHETKGFMREAARVRLLAAARLYPFRFLVLRKQGSQWSREDVTCSARL